MTDTPERAPSQWNTSPAVKTKNAVERSVTALLDELAPERVLTRSEKLPDTVEQHRTPSGCVLQAPDCAVSVSWFPAPTKESGLGELHVLVWRGTVTRRGSRPPPKGATIVADLVLHPVEPPTEEGGWKGVDGTRYDTSSLTAKILSLLEAQVGNPG
jgi:hypothetical protein